MLSRNIRHFRVFFSVAECRSPTLAAERRLVSQSAVTQSLTKLEREVGGVLFERTQHGFFLTERGRLLEGRLRRAMDRLDAGLEAVSPRLKLTATAAQLQALIAMSENRNFTLAARAIGVAQPTVHRAVSQIEREAARPLFERTTFGLVPTRPCQALAQAARLAFAEFDQAESDLAEFDGREVGRIVVGALPLARSAVLPEALARFRTLRPKQFVRVIDGPYDDLLGGVRSGEIDFMIGALREPPPIDDVAQERLFFDRLAILARPGHPLADGRPISVTTLARCAWAAPRAEAPARRQFDALFSEADSPQPESILECGSVLLMRELLRRSDLLGCISAEQAKAEIQAGLLVPLVTDIDWPRRSIGLTHRVDWSPTKAQAALLDMIRDSAADATAL